MLESLPQSAPNQIPEKYRFVGIFIVTSLLGVLLIALAVYKASMELELVHEIDNLHHFNQAYAGKPGADDAWLKQLATENFRLYRLRAGKVEPLIADTTVGQPLLYPGLLEESRINERGGYFDLEGQLYTWSMATLSDSGDQLILLHVFQHAGLDSLAFVYSKRILIPVAVYIWLMVWMSMSLSFLINKLTAQTDAMADLRWALNAG